MAAPFAALEIRLNKAVFSRLANVEIDLGAGLVPAIFDNAYALGNVGSMGAAGAQPILTLATTNVPANPVGTLAVVNGITYSVAAHEPDGTGVSTLYLERTS